MRPVTELSDNELRAELKILGFDAGPSTNTTRAVLEKKLDDLRNKGNANTAASASPPSKEPASKTPTTTAVEQPRPEHTTTHNQDTALNTVSQKSSAEQQTTQVTSTSSHAAATQVVETVTTTTHASATNISAGGGVNSISASGDAPTAHDAVAHPRRQLDEKKIFQELNDRLANYIEIVRNLELEKSRLEIQIRDLTIKVQNKSSTDYDSLAQVEIERDSLRTENASLREQIKDSDYRLRVMNESCATKDKNIEELRAEIGRLNDELKVVASAKLKIDEELQTYSMLLGSEDSRLKLRTSGNSSEDLFAFDLSTCALSSTITANEDAVHSATAKSCQPSSVVLVTEDNSRLSSRKRRRMLREQDSYQNLSDEQTPEVNQSWCALM